jgi:hypothetical protein
MKSEGGEEEDGVSEDLSKLLKVYENVKKGGLRVDVNWLCNLISSGHPTLQEIALPLLYAECLRCAGSIVLCFENDAIGLLFGVLRSCKDIISAVRECWSLKLLTLFAEERRGALLMMKRPRLMFLSSRFDGVSSFQM